MRGGRREGWREERGMERGERDGERRHGGGREGRDSQPITLSVKK